MNRTTPVRVMKVLAVAALATLGGAATIAPATAAPDSIDLRVVTWNVKYGELATPEQFGAQLAELDPDIVFLGEVPQRDWITKVSAASGLEYSLRGIVSSATHNDKYKAILSRTPITNACEVALFADGSWNPASAVRGTTTIDGVDVALWSTHIANTKGKGHAWVLADAVGQDQSKNLILGGDLNLFVDSPGMQAIRDAGLMSAWDSPGAEPENNNTVVGREVGVIDHVMVRPGKDVAVRGVETVHDDPPISDHYLVWADLTIPAIANGVDKNYQCKPVQLPDSVQTASTVVVPTDPDPTEPQTPGDGGTTPILPGDGDQGAGTGDPEITTDESAASGATSTDALASTGGEPALAATFTGVLLIGGAALAFALRRWRKTDRVAAGADSRHPEN